MSTHDPHNAEQPVPPEWATRLLRACCTHDRFEAIEGDLYELYQRRLTRHGHTIARACYGREVLDICVRQAIGRLARAVRKPLRAGVVRVYPLRIAVFCVVCAALLALIPSQERWAIITRNTLLALYPVLELVALATLRHRDRTRR